MHSEEGRRHTEGGRRPAEGAGIWRRERGDVAQGAPQRALCDVWRKDAAIRARRYPEGGRRHTEGGRRLAEGSRNLAEGCRNNLGGRNHVER